MDLNIPYGFLDGEVRDGFYVEKMMKKNWASMIKMLAEIDGICREYGLRYFADFGTLLGAVRHKGFIPWDDDIDIGMLRADYERFNAVAPHELPKGWGILNMHSEKLWDDVFTHVVSGRAVRYDREYLDEFYGFPYVAGVDIFPYDYVSPENEENEFVREVERIALSVAHIYQNGGSTAEQYKPMLDQIEQMCGIELDRSGDIVNQMFKLCDGLSRMYGADESSHVAMMPYYPDIRKECFSNIVLLDFEYIKIPAPAGYEEVLECEFGKDWRTPCLMSGDHEYPYYKKQRRDAESTNANAMRELSRLLTQCI
jgi:lipopolysaccharide cholinephosphotransferase